MKSRVPTMAVFAHPNHELALFGVVQRWRPAILVLTDGGGAYRIPDSYRALQTIAFRGPFEILPLHESSVYDAFLRRDVDFFRSMATLIRDRAVKYGIRRFLCDAVEFFNPIHDIVRPLVEAATGNISRREILEVPITYQKPEPPGDFVFQEPATSRETTVLMLTEREYERKMHAWTEHYEKLRALIGPLVGDPERFREERLLKAQQGVPVPNGACAIHYEARGKALKDAGDVREVITYADHYAPIVKALL